MSSITPESQAKTYPNLGGPVPSLSPAVSIVEPDVKHNAAAPHFEPLKGEPLKIVEELKNKKFTLPPKQIYGDVTWKTLPKISFSICELQQYLQSKFPSEPNKMLNGFMRGGMATYIVMTGENVKEKITPNDIDWDWYVGNDYALFRNLVFEFFLAKFNLEKDIVSQYYLKGLVTALDNKFTLFQFPLMNTTSFQSIGACKQTKINIRKQFMRQSIACMISLIGMLKIGENFYSDLFLK
jgi:hypothetical protein